MRTFKDLVFVTIFGHETKAGKTFDVILLWLIVASVLAVMLESIPQLGEKYSRIFFSLEWGFTIFFSIEYLLRIYISPRPLRYIFSFWGIVDFLAVIPTYLGIFYSGYQYFMIIRTLRLLRVFRILKLAKYSSESTVLFNALKQSAYKISVFLSSVLAVVILMGTLLYVVEEDNEGFRSIPSSIYWAIVTVTTVGYGDIVPQTVAGKIIASAIMITGYAIIAIPTGIVTVELNRSSKSQGKRCPNCSTMNHSAHRYCHNCGAAIYDLMEE